MRLGNREDVQFYFFSGQAKPPIVTEVLFFEVLNNRFNHKVVLCVGPRVSKSKIMFSLIVKCMFKR